MRRLALSLFGALVIATTLCACENGPGSTAINNACAKDGGAAYIHHFTNAAENDAYEERCADGTFKVVE